MVSVRKLGDGPAKSNDSPSSWSYALTIQIPATSSTGGNIGHWTYSLQKVSITGKFRNWASVLDSRNPGATVVLLRQADWTLDVSSDKAAPQKATATPDKAAADLAETGGQTANEFNDQLLANPDPQYIGVVFSSSTKTEIKP